MNLVVLGMAEGFVITRGLGDSSTEPPPTPPAEGIEDTILGSKKGGVFASTEPMEGIGLEASILGSEEVDLPALDDPMKDKGEENV